MNEVTRILSAVEQGDPHAANQLLPLVYDELRKLAAQKLAHEKPGHTLQATALVHEAYLRLVGQQEPGSYRDRSHFFAAAEGSPCSMAERMQVTWLIAGDRPLSGDGGQARNRTLQKPVP